MHTSRRNSTWLAVVMSHGFTLIKDLSEKIVGAGSSWVHCRHWTLGSEFHRSAVNHGGETGSFAGDALLKPGGVDRVQ